MSKDDGGACGPLHHGLAGQRTRALQRRRPQHTVTIAQQFAVGQFELTFADGTLASPAAAVMATSGPIRAGGAAATR